MNHIDISNKKDCCGCTACASVCPKQCIALKADDLGCLYPEVNEKICIDCALCVKVCPFIKPSDISAPVICFAACNVDDEQLMKSSSGGVFISLSKKIIDNGGVVFGASFNQDWSVSHRSAQTNADVEPMMTSKYLQSQMEDCYRETKSFLNQGKEVLFTGTPCQIAGLKHFLRKDYPNLLTVEVICHGVPSPAVWQKYLEETFARPKGGHAGKNTVSPKSPNEKILEIESINFRDKRLGWKKFGFAVVPRIAAGDAKNSVLPSNEQFFEPFGKNAYMRAFLRNWSLRPSCYDCKAKCGSSHADLTIGDFWGIEKTDLGIDVQRGTSCVICRSEKGYYSIKSCSDLRIIESDYQSILAGNSSIEKSVPFTDNAKRFQRRFPRWGFYKTMDYIENPPLLFRLIQSAKYRLQAAFGKIKTV